MKRPFTIFFSLLIIYNVQAQVDSIWNGKYRTVIDLTSTSSSTTGQLYQASDSSIVLLQKKKNVKRTDSLKYSLLTIKVSDIDELSIYNKGRVGRGAWQGFMIGAFTGALIGFVSGDDKEGWIRFTAGEKAAITGVSLGLVGTLIGVIAGSSAEIWIPIKGNQKTYSTCRKTLIDYSIIK